MAGATRGRRGADAAQAPVGGSGAPGEPGGAIQRPERGSGAFLSDLPPITERQFMAQVVRYARLMGFRVYHTHDSRGSPERISMTTDTSDARTRQEDAVYAVVLGLMSEKRFQAVVRSMLEHHGYVVVVVPDMRKTVAGWPDLTFWHPERPGRLHCWEIKTVKGRIRPEQQRAIDHLRTVPGIDARIVRPQDWPGLRDALLAPPATTSDQEAVP